VCYFLFVISFDLVRATPSDFDGYLVQLRLELADQESKVERTRQRIEWVSEGRGLYDTPEAPEQDPFNVRAESSHGPNVVDLPASREMAAQAKPNLRRAILLTLIERPLDADGQEPEWRAKDVIARLRRERWMPNGVNADGMVRNMLRNMASRNELERPNYGTYRLMPRIRDRARRTAYA
jgi:hypothetical protein